MCCGEFTFAHGHPCIGFVKFMRHWEPRWPSISKQSVTRSVEEQSRALRVDIKCEMLEIAAGTGHSLHDRLLDEPDIGELHDR